MKATNDKLAEFKSELRDLTFKQMDAEKHNISNQKELIEIKQCIRKVRNQIEEYSENLLKCKKRCIEEDLEDFRKSINHQEEMLHRIL